MCVGRAAHVDLQTMYRILVVASDSLTRAQIGLALRHWGYLVTEAHDADGVLEKINSDPVDLILSSASGDDEVWAVNTPVLRIESLLLCRLREQVEKIFCESTFPRRIIESV